MAGKKKKKEKVRGEKEEQAKEEGEPVSNVL